MRLDPACQATEHTAGRLTHVLRAVGDVLEDLHSAIERSRTHAANNESSMQSDLWSQVQCVPRLGPGT